LRLRLEDDVVRARPLNVVDAGEVAIAGRVVPELVRLARRRVRDPERERVAAGELRRHQARPLRVFRVLFAAPASATSLPSAPASPAAAPARGARIEGRAVRIAETAAPLLRLLAERRAGTP